MPASPLFSRFRMITMLVAFACLTACGGSMDAPVKAAGPKVALPPGNPVVLRPTTVTSTAPAEAPVAGAITSVVLENTGSSDQAGAALTFGHIFADGHLAPGEQLIGKLGDDTMVQLQLDVKARHASGSVRHALISMLSPPLAAGQQRRVSLVKAAGAPAATAAPGPAALLESGFSASVSVKLNQQVYSASADALLRKGGFTSWLAGPLASEWLMSAPLTTADGTPHPHLSARFAVRAAGGAGRARVDVTVENNWAFEPAPQNFTYDAEIRVGQDLVYSKNALTHFHHARWRKVFWWGAAPQVHVKHNTAYLIASRALPNYDQSVVVGETALATLKSQWTGAKTEPMGVGLANPYMPTTGGRPDIGLLPGWAATYLLSMDKRAKEVTLGTADLAGSWSAHFRDKNTGRPVSLFDYPYMTTLGLRTDTLNPATKKLEAFPVCAASGACTTPLVHDGAHQPGFAYLPYLLTGDHYYLEELQFWAMFNTFMSNPGYREAGKGLIKTDQVRGQAWSLRTLAQAAYITPDADPLKPQFKYFVGTNLDWYNANYTNNPGANQLGIMAHGAAVSYNNYTGVAPWMDDFFTSAVGHANELGFAGARPLLEWKAKFPIARMTGKGACWISGAIYALKVRDSQTSPLYTSIGQAWQASQTAAVVDLPCGSPEMAQALGLRVGEMTGYAGLPTGYPSNMQPALAYAADVAGWDGLSAWNFFMGRSIKPNYGNGPQFAIIPRP